MTPEEWRAELLAEQFGPGRPKPATKKPAVDPAVIAERRQILNDACRARPANVRYLADRRAA